jgi:DNA replication protein DnaC
LSTRQARACFGNYDILCPKCDFKQAEYADREGLMGIGIPYDFIDATMDNWKIDLPFQKTMLEGAQTFIRDYNEQKGLLLSGATGTGKTRLACTVMAQLFKHFEGHVKMKFVSFHTLIQKSNMNDADFQALTSVDLLCIDDFVKKNVGFEFGKIVYPLINERFHNNKPTIITTNMNLDDDMLNSDDDNLQRLGDRFKDFTRRETFSEPSQRGK